MNNKILLKIVTLLALSLIFYLFFVVSFLIPKINSHFVDAQIKSEQLAFSRASETIDEKIKNTTDEKELYKNLDALLSSISYGQNGYIYIANSKGEVLFDTKGEFSLQKDLNKVKLKENNSSLFNAIQSAQARNMAMAYKWNKATDPYNYIYDKLLWVSYNESKNWYIVATIYKDEFIEEQENLENLVLISSIILFTLILTMLMAIAVKFISPINRVFLEIKKLQSEADKVEVDNGTNEISSLANKFNFLLNQVETNRKTLEEQVQQKTKEIQEKLYFDDLTNLRNRQALIDDTKDEEFLTITLIDIDSFDDINELYGFSIGNQVLVEVSEVLKEFAQKNSVSIYRIFGNVFGIADVKLIGLTRGEDFIENLTTLFKNRPLYIEELDIEISIDITLGISIAQDEPLKSAGIALKKAKINRVPYFVYNNELDTKELIEKTMYWREKIKDSINKSKVVPFYQPILNRKKEIIKYETLMRIKEIDENGEVTYILPGEFLDISIKTKQYLELSKQVIKTAFDNLHTTEKQVSINLSFKDILNRDFCDFLDRSFEAIDDDKKTRVVFEILESDFISDYTLLDEFILKYRQMGVKIAIDDFGTGYSNFAHILKIRPNYIKIDGSLIKNINEDKNSYEMVKSIIEFSQALQIKTIAEYIHNEEVFNTVLELGVDEFQGYFFGKPQVKMD